jgi:O-acetyl-ADP-ribose deacetylase (regulator of RNase III)
VFEYVRGNLLSADVEALVNTVNCVGVMGRGIALQFKKSYPENLREYASAVERGKVQIGKMFVHRTGMMTNPQFIINFPTKYHWKEKSRLRSILEGLEDLRDVLIELEIRSVAIPPLGCGLGGLDWAEVRSAIEAALGPIADHTRVVMFEPHTQESRSKQAIYPVRPRMTPGRAALIELVHRYSSGLMDPIVTLLEVHKLMYFMQEAGEPLRLRYRQAPYGPYAENLRHVLNAIEGHYIHGYSDGGDEPGKELSLIPGAVDAAENMMKSSTETHRRYDRVSEITDGFETPFGLELLATVHWVVTREEVRELADICRSVWNWGTHKKKFTSRHIAIALHRLESHGWLASA